MARKEISTPLDLKNMENHNYNYDELYSLIDETDRRISEDMWEEIKDANTMKMLEPVQTAADLPDLASLLPSEEADKSLITVIDEQRVYTYFQGKWQPFNQIDLDPFEPFKTELSEIVAAYESKIQNITTEVKNTKTSAIESIESTQSQSESNINQTEQSAVNSINQTQTDTESQISTIRDEMTTQASDLTALFNDSMDKLTSKQDTALAEVDSAKQAAITALEGFNNTDTSNWQKYKLTNDTGNQITNFNGDYPMTNENLLSAKTGFYYNLNYQDAPSGSTGFVFIQENGGGGKKIYYSSYNHNDLYIKSYSDSTGWLDWKELTGMTRTVLFEGQAKTTGDIINLNTSYQNFTELKVKVDRTGTREILNFDAEDDAGFVISYSNIYDDNSEGKLYEMIINKKSPTELEITSQRAITVSGKPSDDSEITILKIWGVK